MVAEYGTNPGVIMRSPTQEPIEMMRPPSFICLQCCLRGYEHAANIEVDDLVKLVQRGLLEQLGNCGAGIVHEHIEPAERAYRLLHRGLHSLGVRGVCLDRNRFAARAFDGFDNGGGCVRALGVCNGDPGAVGRQSLCDGGADSTRAAGDKCSLTFQSS